MNLIPQRLRNFGHHIKHPQAIVSSKFALYSLSVLVLFFAYQTAKVAIKRHETARDIQTFEKQVADLQKTQGSLQELNQFLQTDFFAEKEARLKLGMQHPGEEVVVLTGKDHDNTTTNDSSLDSNTPSTVSDSESTSSSSGPTPKQSIKEKSNPGKWWDYFFAPDTKE